MPGGVPTGDLRPCHLSLCCPQHNSIFCPGKGQVSWLPGPATSLRSESVSLGPLSAATSPGSPPRLPWAEEAPLRALGRGAHLRFRCDRQGLWAGPCVCRQPAPSWHSGRSVNVKRGRKVRGTASARPALPGPLIWSQGEALGGKAPVGRGTGAGVKGLSQGRLTGMRLQTRVIFFYKSCNFMLQGTTE